MALNASLSRQFEFVQQQWIQYGNDAHLGNDKDLLLGNHGGHGRFVVQGRCEPYESSLRLQQSAGLCRTTWRGLFFPAKYHCLGNDRNGPRRPSLDSLQIGMCLRYVLPDKY